MPSPNESEVKPKRDQTRLRKFFTPIALDILKNSDDVTLIALTLRQLANIIEDTYVPVTQTRKSK